MVQPDLFEMLTPRCGDCPNLGESPLQAGLFYCHGGHGWRKPAERVEGCLYRDRTVKRWQPAALSRVDNLRGILEDPRHEISAKDRREMERELRAELRKAA